MLHEAAKKLPKPQEAQDNLDMQIVLNAIVHDAVHAQTVQRLEDNAAEAATQELLEAEDDERGEAATARLLQREEAKRRRVQRDLS